MIERNPALPRIVADLKTIPAYATACSVEWTAAAKRLPPGVKIADVLPLDGKRTYEIVDGRGVPSRSEAAAIDSALGTNASRHLPKPGSASMPQRANDARIDFLGVRPLRVYLPSARRLSKTALSKPESEVKAIKALRPGSIAKSPSAKVRAAAWRERQANSGLSMPMIAARAGLRYARVKRILRCGVLPKPDEVEALERVLGRA